MTDIIDNVRAHYNAPGLVDRIKAALAPIAPEGQPLTVAQLAMLDQFHTRGILATAELAGAADLRSGDRVLDLGCGVGGPARYLASMFGCHVTGVDISPSFIEAADYLTARCGLEDRLTFRVGDALHVPFDDGGFDIVFLQHIAMNIADRAALYVEVCRLLKPGGRFATYDLVLKGGATWSIPRPGRATPRPAFFSAPRTPGWRWKTPGSRRRCGEMTRRRRSTGSMPLPRALRPPGSNLASSWDPSSRRSPTISAATSARVVSASYPPCSPATEHLRIYVRNGEHVTLTHNQTFRRA